MTAAFPESWADMATRSNPFLVHACGRKARYPSEHAARQTARSRIRSGAPEAPERLWVYPCAHCRGWHLTSREDRSAAVNARELYEGVAQ